MCCGRWGWVLEQRLLICINGDSACGVSENSSLKCSECCSELQSRPQYLLVVNYSNSWQLVLFRESGMCCGQLWLSPGDTSLPIKTELVARVRIHLHLDGEIIYAPVHETLKYFEVCCPWCILANEQKCIGTSAQTCATGGREVWEFSCQKVKS